MTGPRWGCPAHFFSSHMVQWLLLTTVFLQWGLLLYISQGQSTPPAAMTGPDSFRRSDPAEPPLLLHPTPLHREVNADLIGDKESHNNIIPLAPSTISSAFDSQPQESSEAAAPLKPPVAWEGVAVGLFLRRPKWYFKRYHILVHNALANIPENWALQLFIAEDFVRNELLVYHRGLRRMFDEYYQNQPRNGTHVSSSSSLSRLIITELPPHLARLKPMGVLRDRFVWERAVGERVLVFHGDGVLCANSRRSWSELDHLDYVGIPWNLFNGTGGDGTTHSLRSRSAMLDALDYPARSNDGRHDAFLVATLMRMNQDMVAAASSSDSGQDIQEGSSHHLGRRVYQLATPEETLDFGGTLNLQLPNGSLALDENWGPLVVTGTLSSLSHDARNWAIAFCPEIKAVFPSLHHPACYMARPDPAVCVASLGLALPPAPLPCNTTLADSTTS